VILAPVINKLSRFFVSSSNFLSKTTIASLLKDTVVIGNVLVLNGETVSHLILGCLETRAKKAKSVLAVISF
jgi:hypothetical protein